MSTNAVQNSTYNYVYETNGAKGKEATNTISDDASVFLGNAENDANKVDKTTASDFEYACTDGNDDGKLGVGEFAKSAFKGIAKLVMSPITEAMKGNFGPAIGAAAGAVVIGVLGAPAVIAAGAIGAVTGGAMLIDGGMKYFSAENDADAKKAAEQIGGGGFTFASSLLAFKGGMKTLKKSGKSHLGRYYDENGKVLRDASGKKMKPSFGQKVKAYGQDLGDSFGNAGKKVTGVFHKNSADAPDTVPVPDDGVPLSDDGVSATGAGAADDGINPLTGADDGAAAGTGAATGDSASATGSAGAGDGAGAPATGSGNGTPAGGAGAADDGLLAGAAGAGDDGINPLTGAGDGAGATGAQPEVRPFQPRRITPEQAAAGGNGGQGQTLGDTSLADDILRMGQEQLSGGQTGSPVPNPSDLNAGGTGATGTFGTNTTRPISRLDANKATLARLKSMNIPKTDSGYGEWLADIAKAQEYVDASINHDMINYIRSL